MSHILNLLMAVNQFSTLPQFVPLAQHVCLILLGKQNKEEQKTFEMRTAGTGEPLP